MSIDSKKIATEIGTAMRTDFNARRKKAEARKAAKEPAPKKKAEKPTANAVRRHAAATKKKAKK